jgi:hypothetical protein
MFLFFLTLLLGPRAGIFMWWLINPGRWDRAFDSWVWPTLGFVFVPWTTLTFVLVAPNGVVAEFDWMWLLLAFVVDISTVMSSYAGRRSYPGYPTYH